MNPPKPSPEIGPCTCVSLRRASRAITQFYDEALAPTGLLVTQLSLLRAIERAGDPSITALANQVTLDRTTLARNLRLLESDGLIRIVPKDKRSRAVTLTARGRRKIAEALVPWKQVETKVRESLGPGMLEAITSARVILESMP